MSRTFGTTAIRISEIRAIKALNSGLVQTIPFILVGAFCVALINLPISAYQDFLSSAFSGQLTSLLDTITASTLNIIALIALFTVSCSYSSDEPMVKEGVISLWAPVITTFCCYLILFTGIQGVDFVAIASPGRGGTFFALLLALLVPWVFFAFLKLRIKIKPFKYSALDSNLLMRLTFRSIFPMVATIFTFALLDKAISNTIFFTALGDIFQQFAVANLGKESFFSVILTVFVMQLMWFVGIHGGGVVFDDLMMNATIDKTSSMFATQDFYFAFVNFGGAGSLLGLLIALLIFRPRYREKHLAKVSVLPLAFNINETLIFGVPVIFNPFYAIPFILGPVLIAALAYGAFALGFVPEMTTHVDWTTPIIFSGFLSTGSVAGILLQVVCLACSVAIYTPFVLGFRRSLLHHRAERIEAMQKAMTDAADTEGVTVIHRDDTVGNTAREISAYIHGCFESGVPPFYLVYQPKTDDHGKTVGAEALLRWEHPDYGSISPVVLVELCDESGLSTELGRWITAEAIGEYARWKQMGITDFSLSINLNPRHFEEDDGFVDFLSDQLTKNSINSGEIELEITEHMAMHFTAANQKALEDIRSLGVGLSIDDMGIGYSSLTYISDFGAKRIKIDVSLVNEIETDYQQQEIVRSIVDLAKQLDLGVVTEGVEEKKQVEALVALGVKHFQGYYFSKPLMPNDFMKYVTSHKGQ
jgi:lactose/cellobiose-specific phosphotransferase system IIC component